MIDFLIASFRRTFRDMLLAELTENMQVLKSKLKQDNGEDMPFVCQLLLQSYDESGSALANGNDAATIFRFPQTIFNVQNQSGRRLFHLCNSGTHTCHQHRALILTALTSRKTFILKKRECRAHQLPL